MIATDATLFQAILDQQPRNFALVTAKRLERYVRNEFDPRSDVSWEVADKLWKAAKLTREAAHTSSDGVRVINGHKIRTNFDYPPIDDLLAQIEERS